MVQLFPSKIGEITLISDDKNSCNCDFPNALGHVEVDAIKKCSNVKIHLQSFKKYIEKEMKNAQIQDQENFYIFEIIGTLIHEILHILINAELSNDKKSLYNQEVLVQALTDWSLYSFIIKGDALFHPLLSHFKNGEFIDVAFNKLQFLERLEELLIVDKKNSKRPYQIGTGSK